MPVAHKNPHESALGEPAQGDRAGRRDSPGRQAGLYGDGERRHPREWGHLWKWKSSRRQEKRHAADCPDLMLQLLFVHAECHARGLDHVFLKHGAAEVVGALPERKLGYFRALCDPGGLNVVDVIEHDAAQPQPKKKQTAAAQSAQRKHRDLGHGKTRVDCTSFCCCRRAAKARAIHSPTLRLQQNPPSSAFFRIPISSVRSVKLHLGGDKNPFPAGKDLRVSSTG